MTVKFVAEVSSNHKRDLGRSVAFVETAAAIGCDAVKFQLFRVRDLFAPEALAQQEKLRRREQWELPYEFLEPLAERARACGIEFACTPFSLEAVERLVPYVAFLKVASYELLWRDLLEACARTGLPVVLSTGMATLEEVRDAVAVLRGAGCPSPTLLHCVSGYPAPAADCNLAAIGALRDELGCEVGWSDHSVDPGVVHRAVHAWGATLVEFHLDLDGAGDEFVAGHCWLPDQARALIADVRSGLAADGAGVKSAVASELDDRAWRADPTDGLRPLLATRAALRG